MARADTRTWLSLDRWAEILGLDPLHFSQLLCEDLTNTTCGDPWFQYSWQDANKLGRQEVAEAIKRAETMIADVVGYNLLPDWIAGEQLPTKAYFRRDGYGQPFNSRAAFKSVPMNRAHVIAGGQRSLELVEAGAGIVRSDVDGDGFDETATVTVNSATASRCELGVFYPGKLGNPAWRIRPVTIDDLGAGDFEITFKIWQAVLENLQEVPAAEGLDCEGAVYLTTVDVYRVYNDPADHGTIEWEPTGGDLCGCGEAGCAACEFTAQSACLAVRDARRGVMTYRPAAWNGTNYDRRSFAVCRDPDRVRANYYSGWRWPEAEQTGRCANQDLDPYWENAVAFLSLALLDRKICDCPNLEKFADHWQFDLALVTQNVSAQVAPNLLTNPFGTTRGAEYAWNRVQQEGRRVVRQLARR